MATAQSIVNKVNAILTRVGPPLRLVYLRTITRVGGDVLTGRPGVATPVDTLLNPQPYYNRLGRQHIPGGHTKSEDALTSGTTSQLIDDWVFYISPTAMSKTQLYSTEFLFVLKDTTTESTEEDELFRLIDVDAPMIYGAEVLFQCYVRSIKR